MNDDTEAPPPIVNAALDQLITTMQQLFEDGVVSDAGLGKFIDQCNALLISYPRPEEWHHAFERFS